LTTIKVFHSKPKNLDPKLFVGGLTSSTTEKELLEIFEKFGDIADIVIMYDKVTRNFFYRQQ
jgi:RNA recognition motif-containing protein